MLITLLNIVIRNSFIQFNSNITIIELTNVLTKIKIFKVLFIKFEKIQKHFAKFFVIQNVIMKLIIRMHNLISRTKFKLIFDFSKTLNFEFKIFFFEIVTKFDRYYSINYEFICVIRNEKYSIFNNITINTFSILRFFQFSNVNKNVHFFTTFQNIFRFQNVVQSKSLKFSLKKYLKKSIQIIFDEFRLIIANYHEFVKMHAKIHFFFYELHSKKMRSKTICFNKNACYFCDFFFKFHDLYYVFKTHDCLYHK